MEVLEITTPAACMEVWRGSPSRRFDMSMSFLTCSSESYSAFNSGFFLSARSNVIFNSAGTIFDTWSQRL